MLRSFLLIAGLSLAAAPAMAQVPAAAAGIPGSDCVIRMNATPTSWIIEGYDPFDNSLPEATFSVTFINEGTGDCRFAPTFELDHPAFGLSKGSGNPIRYALLNVTDTQDMTPRAGRSQLIPSQRNVALGPNESRTVLYKLLAEPNDVRDAGVFTQSVTLEAQDASFRSLGGTRVVLGINVLPSARIGLSGAFSMTDGHAVVDLGELRPGIAPVPLQLRVSSTGRYDITVSSANEGRLRLGASEWYVPYTVAIGNKTANLRGLEAISGRPERGTRNDSLPLEFVIGDVSDRRAGVYSDVLSVSVSAR